MKDLNTEVFKNPEELADYLCWKTVAHMFENIGPNPEFFDTYRTFINSSISILGLSDSLAFEVRQEAMLSIDELSKYLKKRAESLLNTMKERDRFGEEV